MCAFIYTYMVGWPHLDARRPPKPLHHSPLQLDWKEKI